MVMYVMKERNRVAIPFLMAACGLGLSIYMIMRRAGFISNYSRLVSLCKYGEYQMTLEPGAIPTNPYLPPHLRLDQKSYLDMEEIGIAFPPQRMAATPMRSHMKEKLGALRELLPQEEMTARKWQLGAFSGEAYILKESTFDKHVTRGHAVPLDARARAEQEQMARAKEQKQKDA